MPYMRLAVDFDGTIIKHNTIPTRQDWWLDYPQENAKEVLMRWLKHHDIYIYTNRPKKDWKKIKQWLTWHGFPQIRISNKKELGTHLYIDDRAYRFTNWLDMSKLV